MGIKYFAPEIGEVTRTGIVSRKSDFLRLTNGVHDDDYLLVGLVSRCPSQTLIYS